MSDIYFMSDPHIGHVKAATARNFQTVEDHDNAIVTKLQKLHKKDTLWILGDVAFTRAGLARLAEVPCYKKLVLGNHDQFPMMEYAKYFTKVFGAVMYKEYILTHIPVYFEQQDRYKGNIHGHLHKQDVLDPWYFNTCIDRISDFPIPFEYIQKCIGDNI